MARIIRDQSQLYVADDVYTWLRIVLVGTLLGLLYVGLTYLISYFVIDPMFCRSAINASICAGSIGIAGNVAAVLVAAIGLFTLVWLRASRPIIVAVGTMIILWGLAGWTDGLGWGEALLWSALLFGLCYVLFGWICRHAQTIPALLVVALIVAVGQFVVQL